ncbi:hypothetical protein BC832DRAFT_590310 [Gaertneriomyces semiglobifer]|nr:hypothetical protein BC832DRAFT_590310 [Gaertneriomyces semiglobifer]
MLLKPRGHSFALLDFFDEHTLEEFRLAILKGLGLQPVELQEGMELFLRRTCKEALREGSMSQDLDDRLLKRMLEQPAEREVIDLFRSLLKALPATPIKMQSESEEDLITSVLSPFLRVFFSKTPEIRLCWPNTASTAARKAKSELQQGGRARQPDMKLFTVKTSREHSEVGFGEVKTSGDDVFALNLDLFRLGKFAKMSIDLLVEEGVDRPVVVVVQAVGSRLCFITPSFMEMGCTFSLKQRRMLLPTISNECCQTAQDYKLRQTALGLPPANMGDPGRGEGHDFNERSATQIVYMP